MADPKTMLVRIAPLNNRESHYAAGITVRKADGWCEVPAATATKLAGERMNALNPEASPLVFEIKTKDEAKAVETAERKAADKPGSVDEPKKLTPATPPAPAPVPSGRRNR
jgi:hypothetical protein